jgi:methyl-accepting chemotaxis protein
MSENLKRIISGIYTNSQQIALASKQFSETSVKIAQTSSQHSSYIEEISLKMKNISQNTHNNANNASNSNIIAAKTKDEIHKIKQQTADSLMAIQTITKKITIIDHISTQTKILALNAAVEAAHAKSHGNGFHIIAEEVKRLSEESKEAAIEIQKLSEQNLNQSKQVSTLVNNILPLIENNSELTQNIADSSHEQDKEITHITSIIDQLNCASQENAVASEEMATSTEELEKQIFSLKKMVSYFKINNDLSKNEKGLQSNKNDKIRTLKITEQNQLFDSRIKNISN